VRHPHATIHLRIASAMLRPSAGPVLAFLTLAACKGAERPRPAPSAVAQTIVATRDGYRLRGVASDGTSMFASFAFASGPAAATNQNQLAQVMGGKVDASGAGSLVESRRGDNVQWKTELAGVAGELATTSSLVAIATSVKHHTFAPAVALAPSPDPTVTLSLEVRGEPATVLVALERTTGNPKWVRPFESTEWAQIHSIAPIGDELVVGGSFGGTLRVGDKVVTSGGGSDGFVARIKSDGSLVWLMRIGGAFSDSVQGVAVSGNDAKARIAIAGTFSLTGELRGEPLKSIDEKSPFGDAFVAELDGNGARVWSASFGSRADDAVAGVAIDDTGRVVVAENVRELISIGGSDQVPRGPGDGLVAWYSAKGELANASLIGGNDFDGLRSIAAVGDHVIVGGFFSGSIALGDYNFTGADDSFLATVEHTGSITAAWHVSGAGREEITSMAQVPGGVLTGVAFTGGAAVDDTKLPAPSDGLQGAALVVRGH